MGTCAADWCEGHWFRNEVSVAKVTVFAFVILFVVVTVPGISLIALYFNEILKRDLRLARDPADHEMSSRLMMLLLVVVMVVMIRVKIDDTLFHFRVGGNLVEHVHLKLFRLKHVRHSNQTKWVWFVMVYIKYIQIYGGSLTSIYYHKPYNTCRGQRK